MRKTYDRFTGATPASAFLKLGEVVVLQKCSPMEKASTVGLDSWMCGVRPDEERTTGRSRSSALWGVSNYVHAPLACR